MNPRVVAFFHTHTITEFKHGGYPLIVRFFSFSEGRVIHQLRLDSESMECLSAVDYM